ncbi:Riboflavin synthase [uncultured archaeon]|nr:Riboflavin synthase [uncultured archaeon]
MAKKKVKIGIVDTMFSRVDMGALAIGEISRNYPDVEIVRTTVPGVKDLPPECRKLLESGCEICMALGMVGGAPIATQCAHEASLGIMQAKLITGKHVIEVFVHENEAWSEREFHSICENRTRKHAQNAVLLATNPAELVKNAGKGVRQGKEDEGGIDISKSEPITLGIVVGEFDRDVSGRMLAHALDEAGRMGAQVRSVMRVPGAFEVPLAVKKMLMDKKVHAVAALGYVEKGKTRHDRIVAENAAQEIMRLSLESRKPVSLGMIMVADRKEAQEREEGYARRAVMAAVKFVKELRKYE